MHAVATCVRLSVCVGHMVESRQDGCTSHVSVYTGIQTHVGPSNHWKHYMGATWRKWLNNPCWKAMWTFTITAIIACFTYCMYMKLEKTATWARSNQQLRLKLHIVRLAIDFLLWTVHQGIRAGSGSLAVTRDPVTHTESDPWPIMHVLWPTS